MTALFYRYYPSPIGKLLMLSDGKFLTHLDCELEQFAPNPKWQENNELPLFAQVCEALDRYFNGEPEGFDDIPLAPQGTAFQQRIYNPNAVRAVGGAVGSNPISIIIPCHRILGKDGTLTGFGGGLVAKRFLLQLENIPYIDKGKETVKPRFFKKYHQ